MKSSKLDTRTHILDVAEQHFALYGFSGTSLRGIIRDAKVNVAAVAYHFGTKELLYTEVMQRFAAPVVSRQLEQLQVVLSSESVKLQDVLAAFYEPPLSLISSLGKKGETLSLFLGRSQTEPEPVYSMIDQHYAECRNQFIAAFKQMNPGKSEAEYQWRFEFMLSLIVCFLTRQRQIRQRYENRDNWNLEEVVSRLIDFCCRGFAAD
jgi:AcrR family transcriptional regulator